MFPRLCLAFISVVTAPYWAVRSLRTFVFGHTLKHFLVHFETFLRWKDFPRSRPLQESR